MYQKTMIMNILKSGILMLVVLIGGMLLTTSFAYAQADIVDTWGRDGVVSSPEVAVSRNRTYVIWADNKVESIHSIYLNYSLDRGQQWGLYTQIITQNNTGLEVGWHAVWNPDIAQDAAGNGYAVWEDYSGGAGQSRIYFTYADVITITVPQGMALTEWPDGVALNPSPEFTGTKPAVVVNQEGDVHAIWQAWNGTDFNIYYVTATHSVASDCAAGRCQPWINTPQVINSNVAGDQIAPRLAIDYAGNVYAVWEDQSDTAIYFAYKPVGGAWSERIISPRMEDGYPRDEPANAPDIAVDTEGNAYAVWIDTRLSGNGDVFLGQATHEEVTTGAKWTLLHSPINDFAEYAQTQPAVAVNDIGQIQIVWRDARTGTWQIYTRRFDPYTAVWDEEDAAVFDSTSSQNEPKGWTTNVQPFSF